MIAVQADNRIDELVERLQQLPDDRQQALLQTLELAHLAQHQDPRQLDLFQFAQLAKVDDELKTASLSDIADSYPVSVRTLKRHIKAGRLKAVRFGREYQVTVAELKRFLKGID